MHGPGSIINLERLSVMPTAPQQWQFADEVASPTFSRQIHAERLIDTVSLAERGIDAILFPRAFVCRHCGRIQRRIVASKEDIDRGFRCEGGDGGALFPSRWILYCTEGHITDFEYGRFAHDGKHCDGIVRLRLGASVAQTIVECDCGTTRTMREAYAWVKGRHCSGERPWVSGEREDCARPPKLSMRSASDVYFGAVRSAITIEPESDPIVRQVIVALNSAVASVRESREKAMAYLRNLQSFESVTDIDLGRALDSYKDIGSDDSRYADRRFQEYLALGRAAGGPHTDLCVEEVDSADLDAFGIAKLFAVRRLREVRALVGFQRGSMPADPGFDLVEEGVGLADLGSHGDRKYPAYENRGEGIFFQFDSDRLVEWSRRPEVARLASQFRAAERRNRLNAVEMSDPPERAIFVMLHSFAHLVIRQVSLSSGYSQSSLRERIFASADSAYPAWGGVLIYTASSDADGSLGGLVAQAIEGNLAEALRDGLISLQLCSSDPACALREPKGFRRLSASACHACLVLPETSCERNNKFLDRNTIIPHTVHELSASLCFTVP